MWAHTPLPNKPKQKACAKLYHYTPAADSPPNPKQKATTKNPSPPYILLTFCVCDCVWVGGGTGGLGEAKHVEPSRKTSNKACVYLPSRYFLLMEGGRNLIKINCNVICK